MDTLEILREECNRALDLQLKQVDALDTKAGLMLGAILVVSGIIFSDGFIIESIFAVLFIVGLLACCGSSLLCLYVRVYKRPPDPDALGRKYHAEEPSSVQRALIATAAEAWLSNQDVIQDKVQWLKVAIIALAAAFVMIIANALI